MAGSEQIGLSPHVQSPLMNVQRGGLAPRSKLWPALAFAVGGIFIYAGALKAWQPFDFANDIEHFRILSWPLGIRLAFYLPWLEILCGLALLTGWLRTGALVILSGLMLVFIAATVAAQARGINLDCGCFGNASKGLGFVGHMAIDLALFSAVILLALRHASTR